MSYGTWLLSSANLCQHIFLEKHNMSTNDTQIMNNGSVSKKNRTQIPKLPRNLQEEEQENAFTRDDEPLRAHFFCFGRLHSVGGG